MRDDEGDEVPRKCTGDEDRNWEDSGGPDRVGLTGTVRDRNRTCTFLQANGFPAMTPKTPQITTAQKSSEKVIEKAEARYDRVSSYVAILAY